MMIENSSRYLRAFYPFLIIACGILSMSWASFTPAQSTPYFLHSSNRPERSGSVVSTANTCSTDRIKSSSDACRIEDGDSWSLVSRRESVTAFPWDQSRVKNKN